MIRNLRRMFRPNLPRTNLEIYDYERVDHLNPHKVVIDEYYYEESDKVPSRLANFLMLYLVTGSAAYLITRLMYDYEWDRYFHVYYPASMEYFDVLTNYYIRKMLKIKQNLPSEYSEFFPSTNNVPVAKRSTAIPKDKVEEMLDQEEAVSKAFSTLFKSK